MNTENSKRDESFMNLLTSLILKSQIKNNALANLSTYYTSMQHQ